MPPKQPLDPDHLPEDVNERLALGAELKELALAARARGELRTAMRHAADALLLFPNEREYLDLVDEVALATDDPLSLVPVESGSVHVATAAARARILMMKKDMPAAIELLAEVVRVAPEVAYLPWVQRWLAQPGVLARFTWDKLMPSVVSTALRLGSAVPVPPRGNDPRLPNIQAGAQIFELLRSQFPQESVLYLGEVLLRRRLGDQNATLAVAIAGVQRFPSDARLQLSMLNALRDARRPDEALAHARKALELDPSDGAPLYDAAWAFADAERAPDALRVLEELLQRFPDYPNGRGAYHALRFRVAGAHEDRVALVTLREREHWNAEVVELANAIDPVRPYFNYLPGPGGATTGAGKRFLNELASVISDRDAHEEINLGLQTRYLDSPSVGLALELGLRALGARGRLELQVAEVQSPDPRADKAQVGFRLWTFEGTLPRRVYPNADPRAQSAIAGIAGTLFRVETWDPAAQALAQQMGPDWLHALLAVMSDPPPPPDRAFDAFDWAYRCQVATALVISHLGPWQSGVGRGALYSLVYGPSDWTTDAALVALGFRALDPTLRPEIEALFGWLRTQIPEHGYTSFEPVLAAVWLGLGSHSPAHRSELEEWQADIALELPNKNHVKPPPRGDGGLTLEGGDLDPLVFPGQKIQKLSDYVRLMKRMQGGDFMGAIAEYGLDTMSYSSVAAAWGAKFAADPTLNEKLSRMMGG